MGEEMAFLKADFNWYLQLKTASSSRRCFLTFLHYEEKKACLFPPLQGQFFHSNSISLMCMAFLLFVRYV